MKVLLVEDDVSLQHLYKRMIDEEHTLLQAETVSEALRFIAEHNDIDMAFVDGDMGQGRLETLPVLDALVRLRDNAIVVATTGNNEYERRMIRAFRGVAIAVKKDIPRLINKIGKLGHPDRRKFCMVA